MHIRRLAPVALAGALVLSPVLTACGGDTAAPVAPTTPASQPAAPVKVDVPTWMSAAQSPGTTIIDVRTPDEYNAGHVDGALLISVESPDFQQQIAALDPNGTYALYCRSGNRSAAAASIMAQMGYLHIYDLQGGFADLEGAGMPSA